MLSALKALPNDLTWLTHKFSTVKAVIRYTTAPKYEMPQLLTKNHDLQIRNIPAHDSNATMCLWVNNQQSAGALWQSGSHLTVTSKLLGLKLQLSCKEM